MKRAILTLAAFLLLLNTFVLPTIAHADGPQNPYCDPPQICPP
jgi:hypothetical protein